MVTVQWNVSAVKNPDTTVNDRWPAVILSAVYMILYMGCEDFDVKRT